MPDFDQSLPLPIQDDATLVPKPKNDPALSLIRDKVERLYGAEPSALEEESEIEHSGPHSKHQKYLQQLMDSGDDLANIQTSWHEYYQQLPDSEKHDVWNEFYTYHGASTKRLLHKKAPSARVAPVTAPTPPISQKTDDTRPAGLLPSVTATMLGSVQPAVAPKEKRTMAAAKTELLDKVTARGTLKPKHHIQSLLFGLSMGLVVVAIFMFGFFNERFIAPFVTPSRTASSSPIIIDPNAVVGPESLLVVPKINLEVPVVFDIPSIAEADIQKGLESGVVHYPTTPRPGQNGNVVVVGHSSNNIFNAGKYKFAFALLNYTEEGDTIIMQYNGKRYVYKVYETTIVKPTDVSVLGPTDKMATLTLITCDPPGRNSNRLIIKAEQISPDPTSNLAATAPDIATAPEIVPGNAPSIFERFFGWL